MSFNYYLGPPRITIQPSRQIYAITGQRISLECIAEGQPTPSVVWRTDRAPSRGDIPIEPDVLQGAQLGSAVLVIESVQESDQGRYTCIARNEGGTTSETAVISGVYTDGMLKA